MFNLQWLFVPAIALSIIICTDAVLNDNKRASENQQDTLGSLVTMLAEYMLNHSDEVNLRFEQYEQAINQVLQMQAELDTKFNDHTSATKQGVIRHDEISYSPPPARSCADILPNRSAGNSGIYNITLLNMPASEMYCLADPKGGCGWTLIWRRSEINNDFNRTWSEYRSGFGALTANFFIGLDKLYALTNADAQQLRIGAKYGSNNWELNAFEEFAVGSVYTQYEVVITKPNNKSGTFQRLGRRAHFFTRDLESASRNEECAKILGMGWWYDDDCNNNLKSPGYYKYINSPTYMIVRPKSCGIKN